MYIRPEQKRIVIKVGTSTLTHDTGALNLRRIDSIVRTLSDLRNAGKEVILVTSGAVSAGIARLSLDHRPRTPEEKQAIASVGQAELINLYCRLFSQYGHCAGQVLLTKDVIDTPARREACENTFSKLLQLGCIPVVNENDSISSEELRAVPAFGDNDTLSAYVSILSGADLLVVLSDIDGLYDSNPKDNPEAKLIKTVEQLDEDILRLGGEAGSERGTGGMATKLRAARLVTAAGIPMCIVNGEQPEILYRILDGEEPGTYFPARNA